MRTPFALHAALPARSTVRPATMLSRLPRCMLRANNLQTEPLSAIERLTGAVPDGLKPTSTASLNLCVGDDGRYRNNRRAITGV